MKILILTAWYHPFIHPRAHRWTALAEQWAKEGHQVQVLTARVDQHRGDTMENGVQVQRRGFDSLKEWFYHRFRWKNKRGRVGAAGSGGGKLLEWVYTHIWKNIYFPDDACIWYWPTRRKLFQLLDNETFDLFITVSLPFTDHLLGLAAKKRHPNLYWLADIGDPFAIQAAAPNNRLLFGRKNLQLEARVLAAADAIAVTTEALVEKYTALFGSQVAAKISVIPPLFRRPAPAPLPADLPAGINLGYFGAMYAPTRTPDALLGWLDEILALRPDLYGRLTLHFFGEIFPAFYPKLAAHPAVRIHGLRSRAESWAAMAAMDVLVNIGNTTDFQLPSKAVEYLASGKPVLHLSYVERDPFIRFFKDNPLLFSVKVDNMRGVLDWLEGPKTGLKDSELAQKIELYLVEHIAAKYLACIRKQQPG